MKQCFIKPGVMVVGTKSLNEVQPLGINHCCGRPPQDDEEISPGTLHHSYDESIMGGTLCASHIYSVTYRTRDACAFFHFEYYQVGTHIEIDIIKMPDLKIRLYETIHRIPSDRGYQICIAQPPKSINACNSIIMDWSELVWCYIQTGVSVDNQIRRRANAKKRAKIRNSGFLNWILN